MTIVNVGIFIDGTIINQILISCSPDPTTNSETTNPEFWPIIDRSELSFYKSYLQIVAFVIKNQSDWLKLRENSEIEISELDVGCSEFHNEAKNVLESQMNFYPLLTISQI